MRALALRTLVKLRLKVTDTWHWYRQTAWFQFAHSPLCARYHQDVYRLGGLALCRSCTLLYSSLVLSAVLLLVLQPSATFFFWATPALVGGLLVFSYPQLYHLLHRRARDFVRFLSGSALALFLGTMCFVPWWAVAGMALFLVAVHQVFRYMRMLVKQHACDGCPEYGHNDICSGYSEQADSIRVYRERMDDEWNKPYVLPLVMRDE